MAGVGMLSLALDRGFALSESGPRCFGRQATITGSGLINGTEGDDVIVGSDGADTLVGSGGNDLLCGLGGIDRLRAGLGDDRLDGGEGNDVLNGDVFADTFPGVRSERRRRCAYRRRRQR